MKKLIPLLLLAITLSACGKNIDFKSEKKTVDFEALSVKNSETQATEEKKSGEVNLTPQEFYEACQKKGGILEREGTICLHEIKFAQLAEGKSVTSDATADLPIATIPSGSAVKALGAVTGGSVEIVLDGIPVTSVPTPSDRFVSLKEGGELAFRIQPGSFSGVKVFVYGCLSQSMQDIPCPF